MTSAAHPHSIPAPQLRETADIWFDSGHDPLLTWDVTGRRFRLVDGADPDAGLEVLHLTEPADDPEALARTLAEGLAACDFPPTGDGASPRHVAAALRAAGYGHLTR